MATGGSLTYSASTGLQIGTDSSSNIASLTISGGTVSASSVSKAAEIAVGDAYGKFKISSGSFSGGYMRVGTDNVGVGTFTIDGNPTGIKVTSYNQGSASTLEVIMVDDGSSNPTICAIDATGYSTLHSVLTGKILVKTGTSTPQDGDIVTILTEDNAAGLDYTGLTLDSNSDSGWELIADDGTSGSLQVKYVPEPATMVLLGIGGIGVLIRRRRK